ncbi:MAG: DUF1667 domain-containing protein [Bacilli bacterium]|jgi:CxxC motif-containing protein
MAKDKLICIMCPRGCTLFVDQAMKVTGNQCRRGVTYAEQEINNPQRLVTTTVMINSQDYRRLSVATKTAIAKHLIFPLMEVLKEVKVEVPVHVGDVIIPKVLGTDVDIIATKTILK